MVGVLAGPGPPGELRLRADRTRTLPGRDGNRTRFPERDGRREALGRGVSPYAAARRRCTSYPTTINSRTPITQ